MPVDFSSSRIDGFLLLQSRNPSPTYKSFKVLTYLDVSYSCLRFAQLRPHPLGVARVERVRDAAGISYRSVRWRQGHQPGAHRELVWMFGTGQLRRERFFIEGLVTDGVNIAHVTRVDEPTGTVEDFSIIIFATPVLLWHRQRSASLRCSCHCGRVAPSGKVRANGGSRGGHLGDLHPGLCGQGHRRDVEEGSYI